MFHFCISTDLCRTRSQSVKVFIWTLEPLKAPIPSSGERIYIKTVVLRDESSTKCEPCLSLLIPESTLWRRQGCVLTLIKEGWRSGSSKDSLQTQCVHAKQSEVKGTKGSCQASSNNRDWTIPSQRDTNWQLLIIGNPNYRGLQCLLKLLIITANNYSMPDLPL